METLYRKVQFEINDKDHDQTWLIGKSAYFVFNPNTKNGEELTDFLSGCEEIPDTSHQLEKLKADKAELLEVLEELHSMFTDNADNMGEFSEYYENKLGRIIQKTKQ